MNVRSLKTRVWESLCCFSRHDAKRRLYAQFLVALDSGHLLQPTDEAADDYFRSLLQRQGSSFALNYEAEVGSGARRQEGRPSSTKQVKDKSDVLSSRAGKPFDMTNHPVISNGQMKFWVKSTMPTTI
ncbi:MAG: hypothetical protein IPM34_13235 [Saprospiraceae bacterium]|nr:hypothetical protein [Saprospiraceae bacterium]